MTKRDAILFAFAVALSASTILREIGPHDEGLMLQAAHRIASGELPYRDFWWNYGPGQPLLLAPFDRSLLAWRIVRVLLDATVAVLAYRLAARETESRWTPLLAGVAVAGAMAFPTGPGPNPAALALGLGGILLAPHRPRGGGALAGLAAVFRPEVGVAAAVGAAIASRTARPLVAAAAVAVLGWLPFFLAAPGELLDQTLGFLGIQDLQRLPFPLDPGGVGADPNKLLERYVPLLLVAGAAAWVAAAVARRGERRAPGSALAPLALVGVLYLLGRTDEFHLVPLAVVLPVMLVAAAPRRGPAAVALLGIAALLAIHGLERKAGQLLHPPELAKVPGPAGDGVKARKDEARDLRAVRRALRGRSIFVAPPRFDQVTVGNPLLYVIAGADNPTRYDVIQPGVATTAEVQREIVGDLRRRRPAVLVRWRDPRTRPEDNPSGESSGVTILDRYLEATYGAERRIGAYGLRDRGG